MLVTLLLLKLEVPGRLGAVIPRETLNLVGVGAEVGVGAGVETEEKRVAKKKDGQTTNINASDGNVDGGKGGNARCNRCGEVGHKMVRRPGQMCSICGGKGHSAKICANVVTVFTCEADASGSDSDGVLSGEEKNDFFCDIPGKFFDEPAKWDRNALAWQMGNLPVICDNSASYHMSYSSTVKLRLPCVRQAVRDTRSRGMVAFLLLFNPAVVKYLCCSATLHMYPASATISFPSESQPTTGIRTPKVKTV